jgi:trehalose-6-phosphate synthase
MVIMEKRKKYLFFEKSIQIADYQLIIVGVFLEKKLVLGKFSFFYH